MYLLYSILLVIWGILLIPVFLYKAWRHKKSLPGLSQRLGQLPDSLRFDGRATIWFHSCSVGETLSLQPLVHNLHRRFPDARFVFSTITKTGQEVAIQRFAAYGEGNTFYFPIDLASVVRRVLDWIQPAMIVIIDTEIWPNTLNQARRRGIPVILANGRISASSFRYYRLARPVLRRVFQNYRALMMQSDEDAARIAQMGAPAAKIAVTGNIKIDRELVDGNSDEALFRSLDEAFGFSELNAPLIVAGSTHAGEEQILLDVLRRIRRISGLEQTRLLLAPRHPERFDAVARLAEQSGFRIRRRTDGATERSECGGSDSGYGWRTCGGLSLCHSRIRRRHADPAWRAQHHGAGSVFESDRDRAFHGKLSSDSGGVPSAWRHPADQRRRGGSRPASSTIIGCFPSTPAEFKGA